MQPDEKECCKSATLYLPLGLNPQSALSISPEGGTLTFALWAGLGVDDQDSQSAAVRVNKRL